MKYIMYKISIKDYIYIGSTKDFKQRKIRHKCECKKSELKVYNIIRENGGWENCEIIPIEEFECDGMIQSRIREEYWRREYNANMNSKQSHTTQEERIHHKIEHMKIYREINKDKIREKHNCICGGSYSQSSKAIHQKTKKHLEYLDLNKNNTI